MCSSDLSAATNTNKKCLLFFVLTNVVKHAVISAKLTILSFYYFIMMQFEIDVL